MIRESNSNAMASMRRSLRTNASCLDILKGSHLRSSPILIQYPRISIRQFHKSVQRGTDGVFRDLTSSRISTSWIDALRNRQKELEQGSSTPPASPNRDLSPKKMSDSYHSVVLPLGQDPWLSDTYLSSNGNVRLGTIFMDLDALSGIVAYKHTGDGVTTVTAACDRITLKHPLTEPCDLEYSGQVTYASGRSSMEVTCQVAKAPKSGEQVKEEDILIICTFTMVSLDPRTKRPVNIPALIVETPEEQKRFALGEANSKQKKELSKSALLKHTPNDEESDLIHSIWLRQLAYHDPNNPLRLPPNARTMSATILRTASIMQPQYRNRHNFMIFGGFLLKQTFELAFCCCANFAHTRPAFVSLDPSTFLNPVPVGSVLYLTATVTYTDPPLVDIGDSPDAPSSKPPVKRTRVHVRVDGKVRNVEHVETKPTGQFNYTFTVEEDVKVIPQTYQEYMMYIDARRRVIQVGKATESAV